MAIRINRRSSHSQKPTLRYKLAAGSNRVIINQLVGGIHQHRFHHFVMSKIGCAEIRTNTAGRVLLLRELLQ